MAQQIKVTQTSNADMNIGVPKNLTAVEWLVEQYANENYGIEVYEQAKQMEKEQIINAYLQKRTKGDISHVVKTWDKAEQYYNETYGTEQSTK
jgi:hypothetical protein